ncbi:MAG: T9SS type A sorting domain-containing protein [Bacteroidetes bacterium]|nr:MAG: T9SS type A sorting domain-containing protein [Bacteroidota bacterium]TNE96233.1 MAG: T9SS type A sorting domain-containing protein [Bacteroidota bacterium]
MLRSTLVALSLFSFFTYSQQTNESVTIGTTNRTYVQYLPTGFDAGTESLPVVFCLHGIGDNAQNIANIGYNVMADTARFIVIYPQGELNGLGQTSWNNGTIISSSADDLSFFNAMMNLMINDYNADPSRIYVSGFSMGGIMSYHLACNLNDRVAAIGVMSGAMSQSDYTNCAPAYLTPVMHIHGTADGTVPYDNGGLPSLKLAKDSYEFWIAQHGCSITSDSTQFPDLASDGLTFDHFVAQGCTPAGSMEFIRANGGDHVYFQYPLNDITEIQEIWRFFRQWSHSSPAQAGVDKNIAFLFELYPNPTEAAVTIKTSSNGELYITNATGQLILKRQIPAGESSLDITDLSPGIYYLQLDNVVKKIIKH